MDHVNKNHAGADTRYDLRDAATHRDVEILRRAMERGGGQRQPAAVADNAAFKCNRCSRFSTRDQVSENLQVHGSISSQMSLLKLATALACERHCRRPNKSFYQKLGPTEITS